MERTYCAWLRRYCDDLKRLSFHLPSEEKLERFLTVLAPRVSPPAPKIKPLMRLSFSAKMAMWCFAFSNNCNKVPDKPHPGTRLPSSNHVSPLQHPKPMRFMPNFRYHY